RQRNVAITTWHVAYRKKTFIFSHGDTYHHTLMDEPVETWLNIPWTPGMESRNVAYLNSRWHGTDEWIHFHRNAVSESEPLPPESKLSTYALMQQCNGAIIYGTKTGVELTSMGIPVVVAGEAWIRNKGLSHDAQSVEQYDRMLDALPFPSRLPPETIERARR